MPPHNYCYIVKSCCFSHFFQSEAWRKYMHIKQKQFCTKKTTYTQINDLNSCKNFDFVFF